MRYLLINDDYNVRHHVKVTEEEWKQSHVAGGWMVELFGTNSSYYRYTQRDWDDIEFSESTFKSLENFN